MRILVTGATGFIGGKIARAGVARGWEVFATYRGATPRAGGIAWRPWGSPGECFDAVIHAAALRHRHGVEPGAYLCENVALAERAIELARASGARLVLVSSISVYGWPRRLPIDESFPDAPRGEYGASKAASEAAVRASGLPFVIVQPSITYGPGDTNGMLEKILRMVRRRRFVPPGLGRTRVQLVHVDDVARLTLDAAASPHALGQRLICTYRDPIRVRDLVLLCRRAVGTWVPSVGPPTALLRLGAVGLELLDRLGAFGDGEPPVTREKLATISVDRCYRIDRLRAALGTEPLIGYEEGVARTAEALGLG